MQLCRSGLSANQSLDYTLARNATITTAPSFLSARLLVSNSMALQAAQFATIFLSTGPTCSKTNAIFDDEMDPNPGAKHSSNNEPTHTIAASSSNGQNLHRALLTSSRCKHQVPLRSTHLGLEIIPSTQAYHICKSKANQWLQTTQMFTQAHQQSHRLILN